MVQGNAFLRFTSKHQETNFQGRLAQGNMVCPVCIATAIAAQGPALFVAFAGAGAGARAVRRMRDASHERCAKDEKEKETVRFPLKKNPNWSVKKDLDVLT